MSVVIETTLGDITVDLYTERRPRCCINFLKLCKLKYYNLNLFHTVRRGFIAQTGDPAGVGNGGESVWGVLEGDKKRYFESETNPRIKHVGPGLLSFVGDKNGMLGSQFFITLGDELSYLDGEHCVFGEVTEGSNLLHTLNEVICDEEGRPFQDVRITHMAILCDPYEDIPGMIENPGSPERTAERMKGGRIAADEDIDEEAGMSPTELAELCAEREAKARATILEMVGDIPDAEVAPPENVLFVCKLNPVTTDQDLEIIFSRFGKIKSCEVIRDKKSGDSLQYAFVEFEEEKSCEDAYFKMDNVLIDDRRIHVDFSQSVAKVRWYGRGRIEYQKGVSKQEFGKGEYQQNIKKDSDKFDKSKSYKDTKKDKYENDRKPSDRTQQDYKRSEKNRYKESREKKSTDKYYSRNISVQDKSYKKSNRYPEKYQREKERDFKKKRSRENERRYTREDKKIEERRYENRSRDWQNRNDSKEKYKRDSFGKKRQSYDQEKNKSHYYNKYQNKTESILSKKRKENSTDDEDKKIEKKDTKKSKHSRDNSSKKKLEMKKHKRNRHSSTSSTSSTSSSSTSSSSSSSDDSPKKSKKIKPKDKKKHK